MYFTEQKCGRFLNQLNHFGKATVPAICCCQGNNSFGNQSYKLVVKSLTAINVATKAPYLFSLDVCVYQKIFKTLLYRTWIMYIISVKSWSWGRKKAPIHISVLTRLPLSSTQGILVISVLFRHHTHKLKSWRKIYAYLKNEHLLLIKNCLSKISRYLLVKTSLYSN